MRFFFFSIFLFACGGTVAGSSDSGIDATCPPKKGVGETCALGPRGRLPTDLHECERDLYCRFDDSNATSGVCTAFAPIGASCDGLFVYCVSGATCASATAEKGTCTSGGPERLDHHEGEPCSDDPMSLFRCAPALGCVNNVCRPGC
jgi:hypothetical protein